MAKHDGIHVRVDRGPDARDELIVRLYDALATAWRANGTGQAAALRFYRQGTPQLERRALYRALEAAGRMDDVEWISGTGAHR